MVDEFQKIRGVILGKLKEKPFIQDQQCRVGVLLQYISESACVFGRFEVANRPMSVLFSLRLCP